MRGLSFSGADSTEVESVKVVRRAMPSRLEICLANVLVVIDFIKVTRYNCFIKSSSPRFSSLFCRLRLSLQWAAYFFLPNLQSA